MWLTLYEVTINKNHCWENVKGGHRFTPTGGLHLFSEALLHYLVSSRVCMSLKRLGAAQTVARQGHE